jgi:hypothetical protein
VARLGHLQALADDPLLQEVLPDELLQAAAQHLLALRDQRGVRDRETEGVLEQRRDREPVGDRAHHRRLGAGVDVAPDAVEVEGDDVHRGGEQQQPDGDGAHPAQALAALLVELGVGGDHRDGHQRRTYRTVRRPPVTAAEAR